MNPDYLMDTTRRYHRSTASAFADERAEWFEHCTPNYSRWADKAVFCALALGLLTVILSVAFN